MVLGMMIDFQLKSEYVCIMLDWMVGREAEK